MATDEPETPAAPPLVAAAEQAFVRAHATNVAASVAARDESLTNWLEAFEAEHAGVNRKILGALAQHPDLPAVVADVLGQVIGPEHQTEVIIGTAAAYAILSSIVGAAVQPAAQTVANTAWTLDPTAPLSPADAAVAVLKGWWDEGRGAEEAKKSGVTGDLFDVMVKSTGNPPGPEQLMEAVRRGIIGRDQFDLGIKEGRTRIEWGDALYALRYAPIPASTAVTAAVEGYIDIPGLALRLQQAGIDPDEASLLYETAGRPPGPFEMGELVNRGELSVADLEQAVRESEIKNKYVDALVLLRRKIPPMRSIVAALHQGVITADVALRKLMDLGYNAEDAAIFVKEGTALKHGAAKNLSQSQVHALYADRLITRPAAETMLANLGYDTTEVGFLLALADHQREAHAMATAVNRVHTRYVGYHLSRNEAITSLDKIGVDPQGRDDLIGTWDDERAANAPRLTLAELSGMARRGLITQAVFQQHALELGYPSNYVPLLYALAWPPTGHAPKWAP